MSALLKPLLDLYPAQTQPIQPLQSLGNAGGGSGADLWRFESGSGPLVARAWPVDGPGLPILSRIHTWLGRLSELGFIPIPMATRDGRTLVPYDGRFWEVTRWMPGAADPDRPPEVGRLRAAFLGLAALHQRWSSLARIGPSPALQARHDEGETLLAMELKLISFAVSQAPADPLRDLAQRWLALARDGLIAMVANLRREAAIDLAIQPILRDPRPDHFLFGGGRLTGLVDFGAVGVDSPSADLARLLSEWVGTAREARSVALDAYTAIRPLSLREVEVIDVFAETAAWLGPARWIRWHYVERRPFADPNAVLLGLDRSLSRLLERLTDIRTSRPGRLPR